MGNTPTSPEKRAEILALHDNGIGRNEIAQRTGVGFATVTKIVHDAGGSFDRTATETAVRARQIDASARRARIANRQLTRAEFLQDRLEAETYKAILRERGAAERVEDLPFVPARDERDIQQSIHLIVQSTARLAELDTGVDVEDANAMLRRFGRALGIDE